MISFPSNCGRLRRLFSARCSASALAAIGPDGADGTAGPADGCWSETSGLAFWTFGFTVSLIDCDSSPHDSNRSELMNILAFFIICVRYAVISSLNATVVGESGKYRMERSA